MMAAVRTAFFLILYCSMVYGECRYHEDEHTRDIYATMKTWKIFGKNLTIQHKGLIYMVGICMSPNGSADTSAIIQKETNESYVLGRIDQSSLARGDNWILLTYRDGDEYHKVCQDTLRTASIMFVCGPNMIALTVRQAHTNTDHHCNYVFQLEVPEMCPKEKNDSKLSGGAIFIIVFFCIAAVYFIGGGLWMHFKHNAHGIIEHIPHMEMWRRLGSLAADGCDFCCRCERIPPRAGYFLDDSGPDGRDDDILSP